MKIKRMAKPLKSVSIIKKAKRLLAVTLAMLMVNPLTSYGATTYAQEAKIITAFAKLPTEIANQQLTVGMEETDIRLPDTVDVTIGAENYMATDSEAAVILDSGEVSLDASTTNSAISLDLNGADTKQKETEETVLEEQTLMGITWQINAQRSSSDTFDSKKVGAIFYYEPVLPVGYTISDGVSLPQITVTVAGMMARSTMGTMSLESGEGWSFDSATGKLTITSNNGAANWYLDFVDNSRIISIEIESPVTIISMEAFSYCFNLSSVTISGSVQTIQDSAFALCVRLKKITFLGETPPVFMSNVFESCGTLTIMVPTGKTSVYTTAIGDQLPTGSTITDGIRVTEVKLNKDTLRFDSLGAEETLMATVLPEDATNKSLTWDSTNPAVATVDANGKVKAIAKGNTTISATTADGIGSSCFVIVQPPTVKITTQPQSTSVIYGYTSPPTLSVEAVKLDGVPADKEISYKWIKTDFPPIFSEINASYTLPTGLGVGTYGYYCQVSCDGYTVKSETATVTVDKSSTTFDGGIKTYKGATETNTFTYGDTITVKVIPKATGIAPQTFALTPPVANQMALFVGTTQISDPVNADWSGVYTMTYDTKGKALAIGSNTITAKYVGNVSMADFSADVMVSLNKALLSITAIGSHTYNGTNNFLTEFSGESGLDGLRSNDQVTALMSISVSDANVGTNKPFTINTVELRGADKGFYSLTFDAVLYVVNITKKLLTSDMMSNVDDVTYTGTAHQPALSVTDRTPTIIKPSDYTVFYGENINAGLSTVTITATENGNYYGETYQVFTIKKAVPALEILEANMNDKVFGDTVQVAASVSGVNSELPTGTLTLKEGSTVIATATLSHGYGILSWANVPTGDHSVIVEYTAAPDGIGKNYTDAESSIITFNVAKANQSALSIDEVTGKKYLSDNSFALSATGGSGMGGVTYSVPEDNGVLLIEGNMAIIIGAGKVTVTAIKAGDDNYNRTTTTREITIAKAPAPIILFPTASSIIYGQKLSEAALIGGSFGYGSFAWTNGDAVPTVINRGYEVTFTPNADTVKNYETITSTTGNVAVTVSKTTPAVTVNATVSGDTGSRKAILTATVDSVGYGETPTGTVQFVGSTSGSDVEIAGATAITITDGKASFKWTGLVDQIYKVKAVYSGSSNYNTATSEEISFDTSKKNQDVLSINEIEAKIYGDSNFTLSTNGGSGKGAVSYTSSDDTIVSIFGSTATIHKAGTVSITATKAEDNNYNEASTSVSLTIGKKAVTVRADDKPGIVKGSAMPELTYTVTGLVESDTFTRSTISTTATDTNTVGEYDILISGGTLTNADSYTVTYIKGKLTVVNAIYTVTVANGTGGGSYSEGQTVTITADNRNGYTFTGWSSNDSVTFANSKASTTTFIMPGKAVTVTANYSKNSSGGGSSGGGSSSGGNGAPTTTTTPEKKTNQPVTAMVPITATLGANGAAIASIPDKVINDAITNAQSEAISQGKTANGIFVELNITMPKGTTSLTVNLTRRSLESLVSAGVSSLKINGSLVKVSFDKKALAEIQKQSTGNINIVIAPKTNLSDAAKKIIGKRSVYDITVGYGSGKTVSSFGDGIATVSIPYTPSKNEVVGGLYAVYVDEKGNATPIEGSVYDVNMGCVIFTTTHFSLYGIGYTAPSEKFTDITNHWAKESIDYVVGRGLLYGTSETTFSPNSAMTRGMLVTALGRLAGVDTKVYATNSFTDVKTDNAFRPYIEWAYKKGIVQGTGNGKFEPDRAITREEIAVIFANDAKATGYTLPITREATTYVDASSIGSAYKDVVKAMQQAGLMMGDRNNKFNPKSSATRAEFSSMLSRYSKLTIDPVTAQR
ncbi:S-layer homology domain-containing protein [Sporanaerobium hydrogeniformans]|uniref:S-layer homology domain-containing protein n=1 Tax=Sporanaerobium hydrogeniformans TaxID=3072179 RepID=UPI0015D4858C|nr:S-layer homology domain-containing protein [Sporanaerobium hydrogeniformans]